MAALLRGNTELSYPTVELKLLGKFYFAIKSILDVYPEQNEIRVYLNGKIMLGTEILPLCICKNSKMFS